LLPGHPNTFIHEELKTDVYLGLVHSSQGHSQGEG